MFYKEYKNISEIAGEWDSFLPLNHHLRSSNLLILEASQLSDISFTYLIIYNSENSIAGLAYFQRIHFQQKHYISPFEKNVLIKPLENLITKKGFQLLVCGNLLHIDSSGLFIDLSKASISEIIDCLESFISKLQPSPHVVLFKDWVNKTGTEWLAKNNYLKWEGDLTMKFKLNSNWKTFDDYTSSLRHRYAQRVRKSRNLLNPISRREFNESEIIFYSEEINNLYNNVVYRQPIRMVIVNSRYFIEMKKILKESFKIHGYFLNKELVAFTSQLTYQHELELHLIGLNYHYNKKHWIYFNMLYDAINDSINTNKKELELGRTSQTAKKTIGATPVYFENYYRIRGMLTASIVAILNQSFQKRNKVPGTGKKEK